MQRKLLLLGFVIVTTLVFLVFPSCSPKAVSSGGNTDQFEVIRQAADIYLSSGKASRVIMGKDLWNLLTDGDNTTDPNILSVRNFETDQIGHICSAITVPYRVLLVGSYFSQVPPKDKKLVIYSYTGQEGGGQTTALLNMLGWDAVNLQWGFTCWYLCPNTAPGLFRSALNGGIGQNYETETTTNIATKQYPFPVVNNTKSSDRDEIIKVAFKKWFLTEYTPQGYTGSAAKVFYKDPDITPDTLFKLLKDGDPSNDPFILSVQEPELYAKGHIAGAINIPLTDVAKPENLHKLPPDKPILVVSNDGMTGNQVTGILNALGYKAQNLSFGMTGWTRNPNIAPGQFDEEKDILSLPFCWLADPGYYVGDQPSTSIGQ